MVRPQKGAFDASAQHADLFWDSTRETVWQHATRITQDPINLGASLPPCITTRRTRVSSQECNRNRRGCLTQIQLITSAAPGMYILIATKSRPRDRSSLFANAFGLPAIHISPWLIAEWLQVRKAMLGAPRSVARHLRGAMRFANSQWPM